MFKDDRWMDFTIVIVASTVVCDYRSINTTGAINSCFRVLSLLQNSDKTSLRRGSSLHTTVQIQRAWMLQLTFIDWQTWGTQGTIWLYTRITYHRSLYFTQLPLNWVSNLHFSYSISSRVQSNFYLKRRKI